jgi:hypothetical protein
MHDVHALAERLGRCLADREQELQLRPGLLVVEGIWELAMDALHRCGDSAQRVLLIRDLDAVVTELRRIAGIAVWQSPSAPAESGPPGVTPSGIPRNGTSDGNSPVRGSATRLPSC